MDRKNMNDQELKIYNMGIKEGAKRSTTSPKTMDIISKIKENCAARGTEFALMKQTLDNHGKTLDRIDSKLDAVIEKKADTKKVEKLEKRVDKILWATIVAIIGLLIQVIFFLIDKLT